MCPVCPCVTRSLGCWSGGPGWQCSSCEVHAWAWTFLNELLLPRLWLRSLSAAEEEEEKEQEEEVQERAG